MQILTLNKNRFIVSISPDSAFSVVGVAEKDGDYRKIMSKVSLAPKKPRGGAKYGRFGRNPQQAMDFDV